MKTISVIGTGAMGSAVAENLLNAGQKVIAYNRTLKNAEALQEKGAIITDKIAEALQASDLTIIVLTSDVEVVRSVLFSEPAKPLLAGRSILNVTTLLPADIQALTTEMTEAGSRFSKATIVTFPPPVRAGQSEVMIGATPEEFALWNDIIKSLGKVHHVGEVVDAAYFEFYAVMPVMFHSIVLAYAIGAFEKQKMSLDFALPMWRDNPTYQIPNLELFSSPMRNRKYDSISVTADHCIPIFEMFIKQFGELNMPTEIFKVMRDMYVQLADKGLGEKDWTAIYEVIAPKD